MSTWHLRWPRLPPRLASVPPVVVDVVLAAVVSVVVMTAMHVATEAESHPPDALAYTLALVIGCLLLARRLWPLGVLLATVTVLMIYYGLEYPGVAPALPLAAALYSTAVAGRSRWAALIAGFFIVLGVLVRQFHIGEETLPMLVDMVKEASLLVAAVLFGETIRSRRVRLAEAQERLTRATAEREHEAARRVAEERLRIAREMHDVLGHTIAAVSVQTALAADLLDDRPREARAALRTIREATRQATTELNAAVGLLRSDDDGHPLRSPVPGLGQVDQLYDLARRAGLRVDVCQPALPARIPAAVDRSAYRVVQESLTNTIRHGHASAVSVVIRLEPTALVVEIVDDGHGVGADWDDVRDRSLGHGLAGMRERVAALNGALVTGPAPGGGFRVRASLPVEGAA